jgi:hypothetical protein
MTQPTLSPLQARPLVVGAATTLAVACFVVVVAIVAHLTADDAASDRPPPTADAASTATDPSDAGVVVPVMVGVEEGPDASPQPPANGTASDDVDAEPGPGASAATAEPAPYDPAAVAAAAVVIVERCAREALRWDPSLGGPFTLRVRLATTAPLDDTSDDTNDDESEGATLDRTRTSVASSMVALDALGLTSPVLQACLKRQATRMEQVAGTTQLVSPQAVVARAVLSTEGTVAFADAAIVALPTGGPAHDERPEHR